MFQDNSVREKERTAKELERTQQLLSQLEEKHSNLREENADLKEKLSRADLAKDVLEQEKTHLTELYHKTEEEKEEYETDCKLYFIGKGKGFNQILIHPVMESL